MYKYVNYTKPDGSIVTICISRYAGKTVKGYAKCHPGDTYDEEFGKKLARARCDIIVNNRRVKAIYGKMITARVEATKAQTRAEDIEGKFEDICKNYAGSVTYLEDLLKNITEEV